MRLDWDQDVDLQTRQLTFRRTKNGKMRTAHIPDALLSELSRVPEGDRHGPVFAWSHKAHVRRPLMNAAKRAGLEYLTPHQLGRHTYATWLRIYAKRDLRGLQVDGGWQGRCASSQDYLGPWGKWATDHAGSTQRSTRAGDHRRD
jgi:integrase